MYVYMFSSHATMDDITQILKTQNSRLSDNVKTFAFHRAHHVSHFTEVGSNAFPLMNPHIFIKGSLERWFLLVHRYNLRRTLLESNEFLYSGEPVCIEVLEVISEHEGSFNGKNSFVHPSHVMIRNIILNIESISRFLFVIFNFGKLLRFPLLPF